MTGRLKADVFRLSHPYIPGTYIPAYIYSPFLTMLLPCYLYRHNIIMCIDGAGCRYRVYYIPTEEKKNPKRNWITPPQHNMCVCPTPNLAGEDRPEHKSSRDHSWCYIIYKYYTYRLPNLTCGTYGWRLLRLC